MDNSGHNSGHTEGGRVTKTLSRQGRKATKKALALPNPTVSAPHAGRVPFD